MAAESQKKWVDGPPSTLTTINGIFPYTQAAREIGEAQGWPECVTAAFTGRMLEAILGQPPALLTRGRLTGLRNRQPSEVVLHLVHPDDVNEWLESSGLDYRWLNPNVNTPDIHEVAAGEAPTAPLNNKTAETLAFESAAMRAMTTVWNDWKFNSASNSALQVPTKGEMHQAALNKLLTDEVKGKRKAPTLSMVKDATKSWTKPASVKVSVSPALAPAKRHRFKGDE